MSKRRVLWGVGASKKSSARSPALTRRPHFVVFANKVEVQKARDFIYEYVLGAVNLYLDFINMFLFILNLLSGGRE